MAGNKKFYWLKLKEDFFDEKYVKALRKLPDGDALVIVYLKMQLKSLKTEGIIKYENILPSAEEELALYLDEDINIVRLTLSALINMGVVEQWENDTLYMVAMQELIGSETAVAERVRRHRTIQAEHQKALQCNTDVTNCNTEKREKRKEKKEKREENRDKTSEMFESVWALYPKKQGKSNAYKSFEKAIKDGVSVEKIKQGVEDYIQYIEKTNTQQKYIKQGSTWFNQKCWDDDYTVVENRNNFSNNVRGSATESKSAKFSEFLEDNKNTKDNTIDAEYQVI